MIVVMEDVKLPDLSQIRSGERRSKKLPPQSSAEDTSNWDDRAFSAPVIEIDREFLFSHRPDEYIAIDPYMEQERVKSTITTEKKAKQH
jgi:hypothetical protein